MEKFQVTLNHITYWVQNLKHSKLNSPKLILCKRYEILHHSYRGPRSIRDTISIESPKPESTYEICEYWFRFYNNHLYRKSIFCKGSLLISTRSNIDQTLPLASLLSIRTYKRNLKDALLRKQSSGNSSEWENENFALFNIDGIRQSRVAYRNEINYNEQKMKNKNINEKFFIMYSEDQRLKDLGNIIYND